MSVRTATAESNSHSFGERHRHLCCAVLHDIVGFELGGAFCLGRLVWFVVDEYYSSQLLRSA